MSSFYGSSPNKGEDLKNGGTINGDLNITGKINGHTIEADVPKDAKFTDTVYVQPTGMIIAQNVIKEIEDLEV